MKRSFPEDLKQKGEKWLSVLIQDPEEADSFNDSEKDEQTDSSVSEPSSIQSKDVFSTLDMMARLRLQIKEDSPKPIQKQEDELERYLTKIKGILK